MVYFLPFLHFHHFKCFLYQTEATARMSSFKGRFSYSVDNKGRIALPAKLRKTVSPEANETFIVTRGFEQCLFVYPQDEWNKLEDSIRRLSPSNPQHRFFVRTLLQWSTDCQLDATSQLGAGTGPTNRRPKNPSRCGARGTDPGNAHFEMPWSAMVDWRRRKRQRACRRGLSPTGS